MSERKAYDGPGMRKGLAQLGNLPDDVRHFRSSLKDQLDQAGPIQTRAGSALDLQIYQVNESGEKNADQVLEAVEGVFEWLDGATNAAAGVHENVEQNAADTSGNAFGGGRHG